MNLDNASQNNEVKRGELPHPTAETAPIQSLINEAVATCASAQLVEQVHDPLQALVDETKARTEQGEKEALAHVQQELENHANGQSTNVEEAPAANPNLKAPQPLAPGAYFNRAERRAAQRKAFKNANKNSHIWTDIAEMATKVEQAIDVDYLVVEVFFKQEALEPFIPEAHKEGLRSALEVARSDFVTFSTMRKEISKRHEGRKGRHTDIYDATRAHDVWNQYIDLLNRYATVATPNLDFIKSIMATTENAVYATQEKLIQAGKMTAEGGLVEGEQQGAEAAPAEAAVATTSEA